MIQIITGTVSFCANILQIMAAGIAVYLFFFKREPIKSFFNLLLNYSFQSTLSELKAKLERLNDFNANDESQKHDITCLLADIAGQIKGNNILKENSKGILKRIDNYTDKKSDLTEPRKRNLVSEIREHLRNAEVINFDSAMRRKV